MQFSDNSSEASRPFLTWQRIADWAHTHYRDRIFRKDERIPARSGLLYLVNKGVVRLVGKNQLSTQVEDEDGESSESGEVNSDFPQDAFLGFVATGQPFEIVSQSAFEVEAFAHWENTEVIWLYWHDLENWPHFRKEIYEALRYQNQRKLLWLTALGQRRTIDRLISLLSLLVEEHGEPCDQGYYLPYLLTHAQIGSTIGSTRVTVTRLMGKLRRQRTIIVRNDNLICLPNHSEQSP